MTHTLLDLHDPENGFVVVHPTPGSHGLAVAAEDVLVALGHPPAQLAIEVLRNPMPHPAEVAAAWLHARADLRLVILRAHLIRPPMWQMLAGLAHYGGTQLVMVCHTPGVPVEVAPFLDQVEHQVLTSLDALTIPPSSAWTAPAESRAVIDDRELLQRAERTACA